MEASDVQQLKHAFDRDGYVCIPGFLEREEVDQVRRHLERFIREEVPGMPAAHVFYEDKDDPSTLKQMQSLASYDPFFKGLLKGSKFEKMAETLLEDRVSPREIEYFNKPPRIGNGTPPHQDGYYFMLEPPQAVTMWLALEEVDEENGCVRYVRGSHLKGMRPHGRTGTLGFSQGIRDFGLEDDVANEMAIPAHPGDLLIHHALTVHRADPNTSPSRSRRALGFVYFAESAKEDTEAKEAYRKQLQETGGKK